MRKTVLLIDDSPDMHQLVRAALGSEAIALQFALDGESGVEYATRLRPDLVLLDVDMPGANGFDVCRRLQKDPRTAGIPIIFLTASAESQDKVRGLDLGGSDYVTKPFDRNELAARVRSVLRGQAKVDMLRSRTVNDFINRALERKLAS